MKTFRALSVSERLAVMAGGAATIASVAGFIPGVYRDPAVVVAQSHGFDIGDLIAVLVLGLGLSWSTRGSVRGRLVAAGALGYLLYSFVTYAFLIVLNAVTVFYIAVLGFGVWSFITGLATLDNREADMLAGGHLYRRLTAGFMIVIAALFAITWLREIAGSVISGHLPAGLAAAGWPMSPPYVLDLGFVIPIAAVGALRLLRSKPGAGRIAVPFLVFVPLLSLSVVLMTVFMALDGQPLAMPLIVVFVVALAVGAALAWFWLRTHRHFQDRAASKSTGIGDDRRSDATAPNAHRVLGAEGRLVSSECGREGDSHWSHRRCGHRAREPRLRMDLRGHGASRSLARSGLYRVIGAGHCDPHRRRELSSRAVAATFG